MWTLLSVYMVIPLQQKQFIKKINIKTIGGKENTEFSVGIILIRQTQNFSDRIRTYIWLYRSWPRKYPSSRLQMISNEF